jgi:phosphopantetheinyl transferase
MFRWVCDVSQWHPTHEEWNEALEFVSEEKAKARIRRYHKGTRSVLEFDAKSHNDTKCFLLGRLMLQYACYLVSRENGSDVVLHPADIRIARTAEDKPYWDRPSQAQWLPGWNANVTHAGSIVALAAEPNHLIGIDVMPVELVPVPRDLEGRRARRKEDAGGKWSPRDDSQFLQRFMEQQHCDDFFKYFQEYFTPLEWMWIKRAETSQWVASIPSPRGEEFEAIPPMLSYASEGRWHPFMQLKRFFINWTLKESYIKAVGIGLGCDLQRLAFAIAVGDVSSLSQSCVGGRFSIEFFLDNVHRPDWRFEVFDYPEQNAVLAVATGPLGDATQSFRELALRNVKIGPETCAAASGLKDAASPDVAFLRPSFFMPSEITEKYQKPISELLV